jgi:hypothetical protein
MSLRIWTVAITVAGLALYTLSLLPEAGSVPVPSTEPEESGVSSEVPGTAIYPLIYRDPALIDFSPEGDSLELEPVPAPTIPLPEQDHIDLCLQAYPIIPSVFQEVLS